MNLYLTELDALPSTRERLNLMVYAATFVRIFYDIPRCSFIDAAFVVAGRYSG